MPADNFLPVGDFERVQNILRKYRKNAEERNNPAAKEDIEHLMKMFNKMYPVYHKAMENETE